LDSFAAGEADILVGTQMIAKGLDFPNVTLVGVLDADLSLYCGDYHAQERTFSLLTQVVGRAGRRNKPGRAVIQTFTPENPIITAASAQDYDAFYTHEIQSREALQAPPFSDLAVFTLSSVNEKEGLLAAQRVATTLKRYFEGEFSDLSTQVWGPVPAAVSRLNKRYRFIISFRGKNGKRLRELISRVLSGFQQAQLSRLISITAEINPYQ
jgi:primosomal protein N' (replication factor Y)